MPSPRLRVKRYLAVLTPAQGHFLRFGTLIGDRDGTMPFSERRGDSWHVDLRSARAAWERHRFDVEARIPSGLIAWAAREWDGATGRISPYDRLGRPDRTLADYR